ncbi:MAG: N-acetyl-gamma-glutamyl-phosphate reductase [Elusimicrobiota bacterium]|nr:N-acetyl-gamma-glutamyl-phosphate reductase [Elusimicrobiota bacterium]
MKKSIKVSVLGATGFTGRELLKILVKHSYVEIDELYSRSHAGKEIADIHTSLTGTVSKKLIEPSPEKISPESDVIFLALPHTKSMEYISALASPGRLIIDLSADYRFSLPENYKKYYGVRHRDPEGLKKAVYGIPEINRSRIEGAELIANPGCYATAVILAVYPLLAEKMLVSPVYVDAKSGISGAGKKLSNEFLFSRRYENITPYKVNSHRHMGEIIEYLGMVTGSPWDSLVFCPHLMPVERGILANHYGRAAENLNGEDIRGAYRKYYSGEKFINIHKPGTFPQTKDVVHTNNCSIGISFTEKTGDIIVISAIDNLVKGASGQAVQNMNVALGYEETLGLV